MSNEQIEIIILSFAIFVWLQVSILTIGNRSYSMHYESHALFKRKWLLKLIYFKPKHFHRYTVWDVVEFFSSYIIIIISLIFFPLSFVFDNLGKVYSIILLVVLGISMFFEVAKIIYIDISNRHELGNWLKNDFNPPLNEKKSKVLSAIIAYGTTNRKRIDNLYENKLKNVNPKDTVKIEKLDDEFIQYYRDYKKLYFYGDNIFYTSNKKESFIVRVKFYSGKRAEFPILNGNKYMPHLVIEGTRTYCGVVFVESTLDKYDEFGDAKINTLYNLELYNKFSVGVSFKIHEGNKIVGEGTIISVDNSWKRGKRFDEKRNEN